MDDVRVTVIVLTYRRPEDLWAALPLLLDAIAEYPAADLLVVDNDVAPTAEQVVDQFDSSRLRYVHEPTPGIAAARNRGLDETADSGLVVFIDDDERPQPGWLRALIETQAASGAAAVAGPVVSEFPGELDPWIVAGRFFERRRHRTGTELAVAATNNLLLDRSFVARAGLRFDEAFGLSGGSDSVFTRALVGAGGRILWCDEAVVVDVVPPSRANRDWVCRRAFRMGNTEARARIHVARGVQVPRERLSVLGRGGVRLIGGGVRYLFGRAGNSVAHQARGQRAFLRGSGMVLAAFGYKYFEYRRPADDQPATLGVLESFRLPSAATNPYITQLYDALRQVPDLVILPFSWRAAFFGDWQVFHVHWPETIWASPSRLRRTVKELLFVLLLVRIRLTGAVVVRTYHNVASHEDLDALARFVTRRLDRATADYVVLNGQIAPPAPARRTLIPHGHYLDWYGEQTASVAVPARLASFGLIRPYKGVEELLAAFGDWDEPSGSLVIGGKAADPATAERLTALAATDPRVTLTLRFLEDGQLVDLVTSAELTVFPYLRMHNSGAVLAALSLGRPVLVPDNEINRALGDEVGRAWVQLFTAPLTAAALSAALSAIRTIPAGSRPDLAGRDWRTAGVAHRDAFRLAVANAVTKGRDRG